MNNEMPSNEEVGERADEKLSAEELLKKYSHAKKEVRRFGRGNRRIKEKGSLVGTIDIRS